MYSLSCKQLTKWYPKSKRAALFEINLHLHYGEIMMVVGKPGSGKTTLLMTLLGLVKPDSGDVRCLDQDPYLLRASTENPKFLQEVGVIFQAQTLLPILSAKENVALPLLLLGIEEKSALEQAEKLLVDLRMNRTEESPHRLSAGEVQLTEIARSMILRPKVYVLDDPISKLDHQTAVMVLTYLRKRVCEEGASVLMTTHDHRILPFASQIIQMNEGTIYSRRGEWVNSVPPPYLKI